MGLGAVGQNSAVAPHTPDRSADTAAGLPSTNNQFGDGHSGRAAVPFAVVSRHQLHAHAAGRAAAIVLHEPGGQHGCDDGRRATTRNDDLLRGRSGGEEPDDVLGYPTATIRARCRGNDDDGGNDHGTTLTTPWGNDV